MNIDTMSLILQTLRNPALLRPYQQYTHMSEIVVRDLRDKFAIQAVCFDKDNCLTLPLQLCMHPPIMVSMHIESMQRIRSITASSRQHVWSEFLSVFGSDRLLIVSNSAGVQNKDPNYEQVFNLPYAPYIVAYTMIILQAKCIELLYHVPVLKRSRPKPACGQEILAHFHTIPRESIAIIGDRRWTDMLMANIFGFKGILLPPLDPLMDSFAIKAVRRDLHTQLE